jgi:hypothetical protein
LAEGTTLRYVREGGANPIDAVIVHDVDFVELSSEADPNDAEKSLVTIQAGTVHPVYPQSKAYEKTVAKVEVEVTG